MKLLFSTTLSCLLLLCGRGRNSPESPTPAPPHSLEQRFREMTQRTGILYLLTLGIFGIGLIYDFWTLNSQISELNLSKQVR